jgi:4-phosphopantoate--beta-alanine ligase
MGEIPDSHPRRDSLRRREKLVAGYRQGLVVPEGLIAQGRGEALDYLLGERTHAFAVAAIEATSAHMRVSRHPYVSVNGNVAALAAPELAELQRVNPRIGLEVNLFHQSDERLRLIEAELDRFGLRVTRAPRVGEPCVDIDLGHARGRMNPDGLGSADLVLIALEDGDRCEALVRRGCLVVAIDLNPLSRTAQTANVSIVDEVTRALSCLSAKQELDLKANPRELELRIEQYDNRRILAQAEAGIRSGSGQLGRNTDRATP